MASGDELRRIEQARADAEAETRDLRAQQRDLLARIKIAIEEKATAEAAREQAFEAERTRAARESATLDRLRLARAAVEAAAREKGDAGAGAGVDVEDDLEKRLKALLSTPSPGGDEPSPGGPRGFPKPPPRTTPQPSPPEGAAFVDARELVRALREEDSNSGMKLPPIPTQKAPKFEGTNTPKSTSNWPLLPEFTDYIRSLEIFIIGTYPRGGGHAFANELQHNLRADFLNDPRHEHLSPAVKVVMSFSYAAVEAYSQHEAEERGERAQVTAYEYNFTSANDNYASGVLATIRDQCPKWMREGADFEMRKWSIASAPSAKRLLSLLWTAAKVYGPKTPTDLAAMMSEMRNLAGLLDPHPGRKWCFVMERWILQARDVAVYSQSGFSLTELALSSLTLFDRVHASLSKTDAADLFDFTRTQKSLKGLNPTLDSRAFCRS